MAVLNYQIMATTGPQIFISVIDDAADYKW